MSRGRKPKCRFCGKTIDTDDPYIEVKVSKTGNERKSYYCNEYEYKQSLIKIPTQKQIDKARVEKISAEIMGIDKIVNTFFYKEKRDWNELASDQYIADYLEENRLTFSEAMSKITNVEFVRIRYLSAVIKNGIKEYLEKVQTGTELKKEVQIEFFNSTHKTKNKRRALDDLEDDI